MKSIPAIVLAALLFVVSGCNKTDFVASQNKNEASSDQSQLDASGGLIGNDVIDTNGDGIPDFNNAFSEFANKMCNRAAQVSQQEVGPNGEPGGLPGPNNSTPMVNNACSTTQQHQDDLNCAPDDARCVEESFEKAYSQASGYVNSPQMAGFLNGLINATGGYPGGTNPNGSGNNGGVSGNGDGTNQGTIFAGWPPGTLLDTATFNGLVVTVCGNLSADQDYQDIYDENCTGRAGTITDPAYNRETNPTDNPNPSGSSSNGGVLVAGEILSDCSTNPNDDKCRQHEDDAGTTCQESVRVGGDEVSDEMCKGRKGSVFFPQCQECMADQAGNPQLCEPCKNRRFGLLVQDKIKQNQMLRDKIDILWVIDNSSSMLDEQVKISNNFTRYIEKLVEYNIDFHLAVILTDMGKNGEFIGQVLTSEMADVVQKFQAIITKIRDELICAPLQNENIVCYLEQGLNTAYVAMQKASANQQPNVGFYRSDAKLSIIVVSDDDEMTKGDNTVGSTGNRDKQVDYLIGLKPDKKMVKISSFVADGSKDCYLSNWQNGKFVETAHNIERVGELYIQASRKTGGYIAAICDSDFSTILDALGSDTVGLQHRFALSDPADPFSIVVKVNGVIIPRSRNNGWTYSEANQEIEFHGSFIPQSNAEVSITYYRK